MEKTRMSISLEHTSQKMFIRDDKIREIVNDSDSDGGNFSELSDDTCKVNSLFSSSSSSSRSEEQKFSSQNLAEARKRTRGVLLRDYWSLRLIMLVNTQNVSITKIVDSSSIRCAVYKYGLRRQFLALHEVWLKA
jgi:hypothetical protein